MYRIFFCMFAIHDIHHGCLHRRDRIRAKTITTIRNFYLSVVPLDLPSSRQRRSEDDDDQSNIAAEQLAAIATNEKLPDDDQLNGQRRNVDDSAVPPDLLSNGQRRSEDDANNNDNDSNHDSGHKNRSDSYYHDYDEADDSNAATSTKQNGDPIDPDKARSGTWLDQRVKDDNNQPSIHSFMFVGKPTSNHRHDNMSDSDHKSGSNSSHESSSDSDSYHNEAERRSSQSRQGPE